MQVAIPVGETVSFTLNTGQTGWGMVIQRIAERRQPVILLIEQSNGWRCFRLEEEVTPMHAPAQGAVAAAEMATTF
ncbi:MAG: hypothetical protein ACLQGP_41940 [Isosphaeraceae bacterium]